MSKKWINFIAFAMLFLLSLFAVGQAPVQAPSDASNFYGGSLNYSQAGNPAFSGTLIYIHKLNDAGIFAFSLMDVASGQRTTGKLIPNTLRTNVVGGAAQQIAKIGQIPIYGTVGLGPSFTGNNTGGAVSFGGMSMIRYKKTNWYIAPNLRATRSNVDAGGDVKVQAGIAVMWGQ